MAVFDDVKEVLVEDTLHSLKREGAWGPWGFQIHLVALDHPY